MMHNPQPPAAIPHAVSFCPKFWQLGPDTAVAHAAGVNSGMANQARQAQAAALHGAGACALLSVRRAPVLPWLSHPVHPCAWCAAALTATAAPTPTLWACSRCSGQRSGEAGGQGGKWVGRGWEANAASSQPALQLYHGWLSGANATAGNRPARRNKQTAVGDANPIFSSCHRSPMPTRLPPAPHPPAPRSKAFLSNFAKCIDVCPTIAPARG